MSEHMEKPHTENIAMVTWHGAHYALPVGVIEKYRVKEKSKINLSINDVFGDLITEHGEPGLLLKGLRVENATKIQDVNSDCTYIYGRF